MFDFYPLFQPKLLEYPALHSRTYSLRSGHPKVMSPEKRVTSLDILSHHSCGLKFHNVWKDHRKTKLKDIFKICLCKCNKKCKAEWSKRLWNSSCSFRCRLISHLHRLLDTVESTFFDFIPFNILKILLFFKFIRSIKFRVTLL